MMQGFLALTLFLCCCSFASDLLTSPTQAERFEALCCFMPALASLVLVLTVWCP